MSTAGLNATPSQPKSQRRKGKKGVEGSASPVESAQGSEVTAPLKLTPDVISGGAQDAPNGETNRENEAIKEIKRRQKRLRKKIVLIEAAEEKIKDVPEEEKLTTTAINSDERRKISEKPIHVAVHREQEEILEILDRSHVAEEKRAAAEKTQLESEYNEKIKQAREEGRSEGEKEAKAEADRVLRILLHFLKQASVRRAHVQQTNHQDAEDEAFEAALYAVYEGSDGAFAACEKLANGSSELVKDGLPISWSRINEILVAQLEQPTEADTQETNEETSAPIDTEEASVLEAGVNEPGKPSENLGEETEIPVSPSTPNLDKEDVLPTETPTVPVLEEEPAEIPHVTDIVDDNTANESEIPLSNGENTLDVASTPVLADSNLNSLPSSDEQVKINGTGEHRRGGRGPHRGYRGRGGPRGDSGYRRGFRDYRGNSYGRGPSERGRYRDESRGGYGRQGGNYRGRGDYQHQHQFPQQEA